MSTIKPIAALFFLLVVPITESSIIYPQPQNIDDHFVCPDLRVDCPEFDSGRNIRFKAMMAQGVPATKVIFKWKVWAEKSLKGQGTEEITVHSGKRKGRPVSATVDLLGTPQSWKGCSHKATCRTITTAP
jgi:hypothetical protein